MGLDIILESSKKEIFFKNIAYFNVDTEDDIPFNERCQMRTIDLLKNDYEFLDELGFVVGHACKDLDNCKYTIVEQEELVELTRRNLSEEAQQALKKVLEEVDFKKEIVTIYPWW